MRRRRIAPALVYRITIHVGRDGVTLSKDGHWGGLWHVDEAAARGAIRDDAEAAPYRVETKTIPRAAA